MRRCYVITGTHRKHGGGGCCEREGNGPGERPCFFSRMGVAFVAREGREGFSVSGTDCGGCGEEASGVSAVVTVILSPGIGDLAPAPRPARPRHCSGLCSLPGALFRVTFSKGRVVAWFLSLF